MYGINNDNNKICGVNIQILEHVMSAHCFDPDTEFCDAIYTRYTYFMCVYKYIWSCYCCRQLSLDIVCHNFFFSPSLSSFVIVQAIIMQCLFVCVCVAWHRPLRLNILVQYSHALCIIYEFVYILFFHLFSVRNLNTVWHGNGKARSTIIGICLYA